MDGPSRAGQASPVVSASPIDRIDPAPLIRAALRGGGEFAEVFLEDTVSTFLHLEEGRFDRIVSGRDAGAGIRVIHRGKTAYGYTSDLSPRSLLDLARSVAETRGGGRAVRPRSPRPSRPGARFPVEIPPEETDLSRKLGTAAAAERAARGCDRRVVQVEVSYRDAARLLRVANSLGVAARDRQVRTTLTVQAVARSKKGDTIRTGFEPAGGVGGLELLRDDVPESTGRRAAERALRVADAPPAPAGPMAVVLAAEAGGTMVHEAIGHGLEADCAQRGLSVYSGRIGETVASPLVTVVDDATLPTRRGSFGFDDEGTPSRRTVLMERGVLRGFLYDLESARKDGTRSTGNGRRESYAHRPIVRMTNTLIAPGATDPAAVVRSVERGLLVRRMGGGQVNPLTGDFVFEVSEGYRIEKGAPGDPVRGATLTGNGPAVLRSIDLVGFDLGFGMGTCGKDGQGVPVGDAQPTLRIPEIVVGGEAGGKRSEGGG